MLCPICNMEINRNAKFCSKCGKKVPRCPTCGSVIFKGMNFCRKDGTIIPKEILAAFPQYEIEPTAEIPNIYALEVTEKLPPTEIPTGQDFCIQCGSHCEPGEELCDICKKVYASSRTVGSAVTVSGAGSKKFLPRILAGLLVLLLLVACVAVGYYIADKDLIRSSDSNTEASSGPVEQNEEVSDSASQEETADAEEAQVSEEPKI